MKTARFLYHISVNNPAKNSSTVELQYNGIAPSAAKMPVFWSLPLFLGQYYYIYDKKRSAAKMLASHQIHYG